MVAIKFIRINYNEKNMAVKFGSLKRGDYMKNRIAELRKANSLTQQDLAKKVGVSRQTIISLENGKYNPSIALAHEIAKLFQLSIEEVFIFD